MTRHKGYLLATASGVAAAAASGGAQAADMAMKAPPPPAPVAAPSWAGFYVGLNAGAAWQSMSADPVSPYATTVLSGGAPTSMHYTNFIGGGQIGYNWQSGIYVYGIEADFSGLSGGHTNLHPDASGKVPWGVSSKMKWLSTVRGRLGVTLNNDSLVYLTGGVAFSEVQNSFQFGDPDALSFVNNKSVNKTLVGWAFGGGIEHMLTSHWIVGVEAMYVGLPHSSITENNPGNRSKTTTFKNDAVIARLKVDYKF